MDNVRLAIRQMPVGVPRVRIGRLALVRAGLREPPSHG